MPKTINKIWDEFEENGKLSTNTVEDLKWHILNDPSPVSAIDAATSMRILVLHPAIAHHINSPDDYIREFVLSCLLNRLELAEYAEVALKMGQEDAFSTSTSTFSIIGLSTVFNKIKDTALQSKIAEFFIQTYETLNIDALDRRTACEAIFIAMKKEKEWNNFVQGLHKKLRNDGYIKNEIVDSFKEKYLH